MDVFNLEYLEVSRSLLAALISSQPVPFWSISPQMLGWLMMGLKSEQGYLRQHRHKARSSEEDQGERMAEAEYNPPDPAKLHSRLEEIVKRARENGYQIPLEVLCAEFGISQQEKLVLLFLFFARLSGKPFLEQSR